MARSVCELQKCSEHNHNSSLHSFLCSFKKRCTQMSGLYLSEERRKHFTWIYVVLCLNRNGRQTKVGLEMLDLPSPFNRVLIPRTCEQWILFMLLLVRKTMGTTHGVLSFPGTSCFCPAEHSTRATVGTSTTTRIKSVLLSPICHSPL